MRLVDSSWCLNVHRTPVNPEVGRIKRLVLKYTSIGSLIYPIDLKVWGSWQVEGGDTFHVTQNFDVNI